MRARNPYAGPQAIAPDAVLYGRDAEKRDLRHLLLSERIVLLYSPAGAGKTSLIQAGLMPELRKEPGLRLLLLDGLRHSTAGARLGIGNRYVASLVEQVEATLPAARRAGYDFREPQASLRGYLDALRKSAEGTDGDEGEVLLLDHFEDVLLDPHDQNAKVQFFRELGQALLDRDRYALFSMSEHHIAELDEFLHLIPTALARRFRLGLLGRRQALQAIIGPATAGSGVRYELGAAKGLLRKLLVRGDGPTPTQGKWVEPLLLQILCERLWAQRFAPPAEPAGTISAALVRSVQVETALEDYYAAQVKAAAEGSGLAERDLREWVEDQLILSSGVRAQAPRGATHSGRPEHTIPNEAADRLEQVHLVRVEMLGDSRWYELANDQLVNAVRRNNKAWLQANLAPLQLRAREWAAGGKNPDDFLSPFAWFGAWRWSRRATMVRDAEKIFLRHSRDRIVLRYLLPVALVATLAGFAVDQVRQNKALVEKNQELADSQEQTGFVRRALKAQVLSFRRQLDDALIGAANTFVDFERIGKRGWNNDATAGQLAASTRETLLTVLRSTEGIRRIFAQDNSVIRTVAFRPGSGTAQLAYGGTGGKVVVADVEGVAAYQLDACKKAVYSVAFNPQGSLLATGCEDGSVKLWRWSTTQWTPYAQWRAHPTRIWVVAFNADGTQVASGADEDRVRLMPLPADRAPLQSELIELPLKTIGHVWSLAFSPVEAGLLLAGDGVGNLWRCELDAHPTPTQGPRCALQWRGDPEKKPGETDAVLAIAFSPDGKRVATGHWRGMVWLWDNSTQAAPRALATRPSPVTSVLFMMRKGQLRLAYGADARLQTVPVEGEARSRGRSPMSGDDVGGLAYHPPTGRLAAAMLGGYVAVVDTAETTSRVATRWPPNTAEPDSLGLDRLKRPADDGALRGAVVHRDREGTWFAIADADDLVLLVVPADSSAGTRIVQRISPPEGQPKPRLLRVSASASNKRVVTLDKEGTLRFWRFADGRLGPDAGLDPIEKSAFGGRTPARVILSNDGRRLLLSASGSAELLAVELRDGQQPEMTDWFAAEPLSRVREIALSADGKLLAAGGAPAALAAGPSEDMVALWDWSKARPIQQQLAPMRLDRLAAKVNELALVTDRRDHALVVAGGELGQINMWRADNGVALPPKRADSRPVQQFAFSATEHLLAAADDRGRITLWQTDSWDMVPLSTGSDAAQKVGLLGFAGNNSVLVSGATDLTLWDLDLHSLHAKVCSILGVRPGAPNPGLSRQVTEACAAAAPQTP